MNPHRQVRGLTMVELVVVMAIAAILAGLALPSFGTMLLRRHLEGAAAQIHADLQYLRSESVARRAVLRIAFHASPGGGSCYVIHAAGAECRCDAVHGPDCPPGDAPLRVAAFAPDSLVQVHANVGAMHVDPRLGTVSPAGTIRVSAGGRGEIRHVVSLLGRVRTCSAGIELPGLAACAS